jgi:hypothetical protein
MTDFNGYPQPQQPPQQPAPKKKRGCLIAGLIGASIVALVVAVIVAVALAGLIGASNETAGNPAAPRPRANPSTIEQTPLPAPTEEPSSEPSDEAGSSDNMTASFNEWFTWQDGMEAKVTKPVNHQAKEFDDAAPDGNDVIVRVKFRNGSHGTVDLGLCTVNLSYGPDGNSADVAYTEGTDGTCDGKVLPGRTKTFSFAFAVSRSKAKDLVFEVAPTYDYESAFFE